MKTLLKIVECILAFATFLRRRSSKKKSGNEED